MPYIPQERRAEAANAPTNAGELNYAITRLVRDYLHRLVLPFNYQDINDVLGALEGAKAEFYRRVAQPYEDGKCATNGDVYEGVR